MIKNTFLITLIFCIVYGTIMLFTNITKTFFILWMISAAVVFILYRIYQLGIVDKVHIIVKRVFVIFVSIFIIAFLINLIDVSRCFYSKPKKNLDYIIVLGALVTKDGPAMSTIYRLDEAIKYLNENQNTKCILTGGKGDNEPECESIVMAQYLIDNGIKSDRLLIENESTSTLENLENSKLYCDVENNSIGIVTNNFHICRALFLAEKLGYKDVSGLSCYSLPINTLSNVLREAVSLLIYRIIMI